MLYWRKQRTLQALVSGWALAVGAQPCPPNAVNTGAYLSVAAFRQNGAPLGAGTVPAGETIILRAAVFYAAVDLLNGVPTASFSSGNILLFLPNALTNVTPAAGIPVLGPRECAGVPIVQSRPALYRVTEADGSAGRILIRATYAGRSSLNILRPAGASSALLVRTRPNPKLAAAKATARRPPVPGRRKEARRR